MVAQNVGAAQHGRVGEITIAGLIANSVVTVLLTGLLLAFDAPLLALFLGEGSGAIPIAERMESLNAAAAGTVALFEASRQRNRGQVTFSAPQKK